MPVNLFSGLAARLYGGAALLLLAALAVQTVRIEGAKLWPVSIAGMRQQVAERTRERDAIAAAHAKFVADAAAASAAAAAAAEANVARVRREFAAINERTEDAYQARLDDTAGALERVRRDLADIAARDTSDTGGARVPAALTARCRALGAADCDALLAALPDLLAAAEDNTGKLIALQDWVRAALAVDFAGEEAAQ
ncbi:MAG: hypothetical protein ACOY45_15650 [Pseudomonadota bacterium]